MWAEKGGQGHQAATQRPTAPALALPAVPTREHSATLCGGIQTTAQCHTLRRHPNQMRSSRQSGDEITAGWRTGFHTNLFRTSSPPQARKLQPLRRQYAAQGETQNPGAPTQNQTKPHAPSPPHPRRPHSR
eukprot:351762-Chlamydomonas_euryale.AAC.10